MIRWSSWWVYTVVETRVYVAYPRESYHIQCATMSVKKN